MRRCQRQRLLFVSNDPPLQFLSALEFVLEGAMVVFAACARLFSGPLSVSPASTPKYSSSSPDEDAVEASLVGQGAADGGVAEQLSISVPHP